MIIIISQKLTDQTLHNLLLLHYMYVKHNIMNVQKHMPL